MFDVPSKTYRMHFVFFSNSMNEMVFYTHTQTHDAICHFSVFNSICFPSQSPVLKPPMNGTFVCERKQSVEININIVTWLRGDLNIVNRVLSKYLILWSAMQRRILVDFNVVRMAIERHHKCNNSHLHDVATHESFRLNFPTTFSPIFLAKCKNT